MKTIFNFSANIRIFFVKILFNHRLWGALNIFGGRTIKTSIQNNIRCLLADSQFC
ncbi:hypothetical protein [Candidatus Tisiphia endosymbiont of Parasteatoda lunata]|uniref:hypothetical protein n=1 Tax=Candidatus Tisiphia endosymbiont of Parasteatoda lunata TaxID=3066275 RepID=UPI00313CFC1D